jgi:cell division protein FtsI (penicillin-binding protein 3)
MLVLWLSTFAAFVALVVRSVSLQASPPPRLEQALEEAREQRIAEVTLPAERGSFFDRNGVELAISVEQTTITANAKAVADPVAAANDLAPLLQRDPTELATLLSSGRSFVYLARKVDDTTASAVEALRKEKNYGFIGFEQEPKRFYPSGNELALSVLGRTDPDGKGISGLEKLFDEGMQGTDGVVVSERGTRGRTIPGGQQQVTAPVPGTSYVLTLDRALQYETEKILKRVVDEQKAKGATAVVMNPRTGEILANANVVREEGVSAHESADNRAVTWTFEPGSIMKTITMAGVLEEGLANPVTERLISAKISSYEMEFTDEGRAADLVMTPTDILTVSSNNGTVTWAEELGKSKLHETFTRFGMGRRTNLGFPGESGGTVRPVKSWDDISFRTMSYGLGVSATPLQLLNAYNTLANGGVNVPPRLVLGEQDADGVFTEAEPVAGTRVVSPATAAGMTEMLTSVVARTDGTGKKAQVAGFSVAGKTGTAWKAFEEGGYGYPGARRYVVSFAGFLPASDPQLSIIVVIDEPVDQRSSGGRTAAPVFGEIASFAVRQLRIPPDLDAATPSSTKDRVRATPQGVAAPAAEVLLGPPAPVSTTTARATTTTARATTTTKATTTTARATTTTKATTTTAKATTTTAKVAAAATTTTRPATTTAPSAGTR